MARHRQELPTVRAKVPGSVQVRQMPVRVTEPAPVREPGKVLQKALLRR
jgi:hypothetical protein